MLEVAHVSIPKKLTEVNISYNYIKVRQFFEDVHNSKITERGQITIPKKIRKQAGLKPGDTVRYSVQDGVIQLRPLISAKSLYGILRYEGPRKSDMEVERALEEAMREKWGRGR